jgi:hypothetical protein
MATNVCAGVWYTKFVTSRRVLAIVIALLPVVAMPAAAEGDAGSLTLTAGGNGAGFAGDDGPATSAKLDGPHGAAVGPDGTLYIADTGNHRVRAVAPDGTIRTVAGDGGETGLSESIPARSRGTAISLGRPTAVTAGADGSVYVADSLVGRVYKLAGDGSIALVAELDGGGARELRGLAVGADGTVFVSDRGYNRVVALSSDGTETVVAGVGAAPGSHTPVVAPSSLAAGNGGDLWIAGHYLFRVRAGAVAPVTLAGSGKWAVGDGTRWPPAEDPLINVGSVAASGGDVFAVSRSLRTVVRLSEGGMRSTLMGLPADPFGASDPVELAASDFRGGRLYLIDTTGSRIFAVGVPASETTEPSEGRPTWVWVASVIALAAVVAVGVVIARRRRHQAS